jgi:site-specific recombinase XerD
MLSIFRRHLTTCPSSAKGRAWKRCSCPIWMGGSIGTEKVPRRSLNLTSWDAAEELLAEMKKAGSTQVAAVVAPKPLQEAVKLFLAEAETRNLAEATLRLYRRFIGRQLPAWAESKGFRYVKQLTFPELVEFKSSWKMKPATAAKRLELLKQFMGFCVAAEWIQKNPAADFKPPQSDEPPTLPYTEDEMKRILAACEKYSHHGDHGKNRPTRIKSFVLLLRYSGLRIQDATCLETEKLHGDDLMLRTGKTGHGVFVPLPPYVADALRFQATKNSSPRYFFWSGNGKALSAVSSWQRTLRKVLKDAGVSKGQNMLVAHRFRDTLATSLLANGVPIEDVAAILGHSVRVCEKHYSAWVKARQVRLTERVRATWPDIKPTLKVIQGGG